MKKSEMLKVLKQSINKHFQDMECCTTDEQAVEHILSDLEKAGMQPPLQSVEHRLRTEGGDIKYFKKVAMWQPEDDNA